MTSLIIAAASIPEILTLFVRRYLELVGIPCNEPLANKMSRPCSQKFATVTRVPKKGLVQDKVSTEFERYGIQPKFLLPYF